MSRFTTVSLHSPSNAHMGNMQPGHEFTPQISHAVQEIHPIDSANHYGSESSQPYSGSHSYDVLPPGVDREPPPPGFENEVKIRFLAYSIITLRIILISMMSVFLFVIVYGDSITTIKPYGDNCKKKNLL